MSRRSVGIQVLRWGMCLTLAASGAAAAWVWRWLDVPMPLNKPEVTLIVEAGNSPRMVAQAWVDAGVQTSPWLLYQWFRWSGQSRQMRAGSYAAAADTTPRDLLNMMVMGREALEALRLPEGQTFQEWRNAFSQAGHLKPDSSPMSESALMQAIGASGQAAEGRFFPDTYAYGRGISDLALWRRAYQQMAAHLEAEWAQRAPDTPLKTPYEALILASIVEKETGQADERGLVAGVFVNRLRIGMPLQTDPTIIYGLGAAFDGNLRKRDLQTDGPYNTYLRGGLPPTPITMPSLASLQAAVRPAETKALYFVARGDGTSQFSETLAEHNRAVNQFQRRRNK